MEIKLQETESKGYVTAHKDGRNIGTMTYSIAGKELIIIDSTYVDPDFKGKGIGKQLLYSIVEMARNKNIKIIPLCPFASTMFQKLEDIKDVIKS